MNNENSIRRFRNGYAALLRLYPKRYRERFGEPMEQTFNDLLREREKEERGLFGFALWLFVETSTSAIRENLTMIITHNRNIIRMALATALLLPIPLVAMQFTDEVNWDPGDFLVAGTLLIGTGLAYELMARKARNIEYRVAAGIAVATALLLVWANLAVGIIGNPGNANVMYIGVLAVGFIGALVARFRPHGMARAMFATAAAQILVAVIALAAGLGASGPNWPRDIVVATGLLAALWVASGVLFRRGGVSNPK